ncbi:MAG: hypothetical protein ACJAY8_001447 [Sphingobacteriales bacterium]|jgi:hypothetical protein
MKHLFIILIWVSSSFLTFAQEVIKSTLIINDSLFSANNIGQYQFTHSTGGVSHNAEDINQYIRVVNDTLFFNISYGGGCGLVEQTLATDGVLKWDKLNRPYFEVHFYFNDQDMCKALRHKSLSFDLKNILEDQGELYIQLDDFKHKIRIR